MAPAEPRIRKHYGQICPVATALDIVGDRWTLLILRELLGGPARFHELEAGLPGIAKNLLANRLRRLEDDGVVRRVSAQSAALYALTEHGAAIRPAIELLGFWGGKLTPVAPPEHARSVRAIAMALQAILTRSASDDPEDRVVLELDVDGEPLEVVLGSRPTATARPAPDADARLVASGETMAAYLGSQPLPEGSFALAAGDPMARAVFLRAVGVER